MSGSRIWELTGVPYTSARRPGGITDAIAVLRRSGLAARLATLGIEDAGDLTLAPPSAERGASGLVDYPQPGGMDGRTLDCLTGRSLTAALVRAGCVS